MTYTATIGIFAAALAVAPASAQLGLGRVAGSVGGTLQGSERGTVLQPGDTLSGAGMASGRGQIDGVNSSFGVAQREALSTRISPLLPPSASMPAAEAGFHSDSDFLATLHAAHNLNIPFDRMKAITTGKGAVSLNAAIHKFRPDLDSRGVKETVSLARHESDRDIREAASTGARDKVAARVTSDERLAGRIGPMVPSGQSLSEAAAGFRNEDQFLATLHAANDNNIAFSDLKDRVTAGQPLGVAIHQMKPSLDATASASAAAKAEAQGRNDRLGGSASVATAAKLDSGETTR